MRPAGLRSSHLIFAFGGGSLPSELIPAGRAGGGTDRHPADRPDRLAGLDLAPRTRRSALPRASGDEAPADYRSIPVTTLLRSAAMSDGSKAKEEARNAVEESFASTEASECQERLGQGTNPGLTKKTAAGVTRSTNAKTYGHEFKRHAATPIN